MRRAIRIALLCLAVIAGTGAAAWWLLRPVDPLGRLAAAGPEDARWTAPLVAPLATVAAIRLPPVDSRSGRFASLLRTDDQVVRVSGRCWFKDEGFLDIELSELRCDGEAQADAALSMAGGRLTWRRGERPGLPGFAIGEVARALLLSWGGLSAVEVRPGSAQQCLGAATVVAVGSNGCDLEADGTALRFRCDASGWLELDMQRDDWRLWCQLDRPTPAVGP